MMDSFIKEKNTRQPKAVGHEAGVMPPPKPIPVSEGERIAKNFGYEQVFIFARRTGENGIEHLTTYGINKAHCDIAAKIGNFLKYKIMNWKPENTTEH